MKHKAGPESSHALPATITFSEKRKFNPEFSPSLISLEEFASDLPFYPAEAEQELKLPPNPHFENLFTNPAYLKEISEQGGLSQLTDDLGDGFILEAANRALVDHVYEDEEETSDDTYEIRRDALSQVILGKPGADERQFFDGVRDHFVQQQALRERTFPTWMEEGDFADLPELKIKAMNIAKGRQYAEDASRRLRRPVAALTDEQFEKVGRDLRHMEQLRLEDPDAVRPPTNPGEYAWDAGKLILGGAADGTLATAQGFFTQTGASLRKFRPDSTNAQASARSAEAISAEWSQLRQTYTQVYKVNPAFAENFMGRVFTAIGHALPVVSTVPLGPAAVVPLELQGFQYAWDDAEETARHLGQPFDPDRAFAYSLTMGAINAVLNFAKTDAILRPWLKTTGPAALWRTLLDSLKSSVLAGGMSTIQGGLNDLGATKFNIETRAPFDPERRWTDFSVNTVAALPFAGAQRFKQAQSERKSASQHDGRTNKPSNDSKESNDSSKPNSETSWGLPKRRVPINEPKDWSKVFGGQAIVRRTGLSVKQVLNRDFTDLELTHLAGAPEHAVVIVAGVKEKGLSVKMTVKSLDAGTQIRKMYANPDGTLSIRNISVRKSTTMRGYGAHSLSLQVKAARKLGFKSIRASAFQNDIWNGAYTWGRLGFDRVLSAPEIDQLPSFLKGSTRVSHIVKSPEGVQWWGKNAMSGEMTFSLHEGSGSVDHLRDYIQENNYLINLDE